MGGCGVSVGRCCRPGVRRCRRLRSLAPGLERGRRQFASQAVSWHWCNRCARVASLRLGALALPTAARDIDQEMRKSAAWGRSGPLRWLRAGALLHFGLTMVPMAPPQGVKQVEGLGDLRFGRVRDSLSDGIDHECADLAMGLWANGTARSSVFGGAVVSKVLKRIELSATVRRSRRGVVASRRFAGTSSGLGQWAATARWERGRRMMKTTGTMAAKTTANTQKAST